MQGDVDTSLSRASAELTVPQVLSALRQSSTRKAAPRHSPFEKEGERKIVLATPIAETSLTIEGVRIVVDSGLAENWFTMPERN